MSNTTARIEETDPEEIEKDILGLLENAHKSGIKLPLIELNYPDFYTFVRHFEQRYYMRQNNSRSFVYHSYFGDVMIEPSRSAPPRKREWLSFESQQHPLYKLLKSRKVSLD